MLKLAKQRDNEAANDDQSDESMEVKVEKVRRVVDTRKPKAYNDFKKKGNKKKRDADELIQGINTCNFLTRRAIYGVVEKAVPVSTFGTLPKDYGCANVDNKNDRYIKATLSHVKHLDDNDVWKRITVGTDLVQFYANNANEAGVSQLTPN